MSHIDFNAADGRTYVIEIDDDGVEITVSHQGQKLGTITLSRQEEGDDRHIHTYYHIINLSLDDCAGIGIGRRCLMFHREEFDAPITAGTANGQKMDDGSHLTGNGPGFIARMRELGIVEPAADAWSGYSSDDE